MYIVSKFRDYYDTAATYGIDKTVVYTRERKEIELPRYRYGQDTGHDYIRSAEENGPDRVKIIEFLVGFCGQVYQGVRFEMGDKKAVVYSAEQFFLEAVDFGLKVDWKAKNTSWSRMYFWRGGLNAGYIKDYFAKDFTKILGGKFVEYHTPIFTVTLRGYKQLLTVNDTLKDYLFAKVQDPASAFQNIYMYISGVLGAPPKPPSEPSDKLKAQIHGHDGEYSFKKPPGGKKWR